MNEVSLNGVKIAYEVYGNGTPLVFTNGGIHYPCDDLRPMARALAREHTVVIHDCRNSGRSGISLADYDHEFGIIADDIRALMDHLGLTPCFVGGLSGGFLKTLQVATRHPDILKGLVLVWPMDRKVLTQFADKNYAQIGQIAVTEGMAAVAEKWERRSIESEKAELSDYIRNMNPEAFAKTMRKWATYQTSGIREFWGLTAQEMGGFGVPVLIIPGDEEWHPKEAAEELHALVTNSKIHYASDTILSEFHQIRAERSGQRRGEDTPIAYFLDAISPVIGTFMDQNS